MLESGPAAGGDRVLWRGRCGVAEYSFDQAASLPRWTLPETTEVLVTDQRVLYAYRPDGAAEITSGEMRWLWPQFLRLQPGRREAGNTRSMPQVQLVCGGADGSFPALVFAGGDLSTVGKADRMANAIRQAVVRFRLDHEAELGLSAAVARMLSRLLIGPEFLNHEGGEGQTVSLLGALPVAKPAVEEPAVEEPAAEPDLAERAARVAAQLADLISSGRFEPDHRYDAPTVNLTDRARAVKRSAARLAANSARGRAAALRRPDREPGGFAARSNRGG